MFNTVALNKRGLTATLTLTVILLTFMFTIVSASAVNLDYFGWDLDSDGTDEYGITLKEAGTYVTSPATGYRWTYEVYAASTFSGNSTNLRAISHWILAFCGGESSILDSNYIDDIDYSNDPTTGIWGIKFDVDFPVGTTEVWFILDADYPSAEVPVGMKPGQLILRGTIQGPLVSSGIYDLVLEAVDVAADNVPPWLGWRMKATATAGATTPSITRVEFKWYGPFTPGSPLGPDLAKFKWAYNVTGSSTFIDWYRQTVDSGDTDSYHATGLLAYDDIGAWYVEAWFYEGPSGGKYSIKGLASTTLDVSAVPEFSSLALVLFATVGAVILFKRRGILKISI